MERTLPGTGPTAGPDTGQAVRPAGTGTVIRSGGGDLVPRGLRAAALWTVCLVAVAAGIYLLMVLLAQFKVLVVPILVALLVVALVKPLTDLGSGRFGMPRALAAILTIFFVIGVLVGLGALIGERTAEGFPELQARSAEGLAELQRTLAEGPLHLTTAQMDDYVTQVQQSVSENSSRLVTGALGVASTAGHVASGFFIALFAMFFFLSGGDRIWNYLVRLFPRTARARVQGAGVRAWSTLTSFVRATVIVALVDAIGIGLGAFILGVPLAIPIGVLVFLGAFVPIVGALLTGVVAVLVALVAKGPVVALLMLGVVLLVQQLESHILQPFLLGRAVSVHPLAVILGIGAGVLIAGIVGALFAVPLVAVAHVVGQYLTSDEPEPDPDSPPGDPDTRTPQEDADAAAEEAGPLADAPTPQSGQQSAASSTAGDPLRG